MKQSFATDPRTMWAWADYSDSPMDLPVSDVAARQILEAIPAGEHVEIFGAVMISPDWNSFDVRGNNLPAKAVFSARTFSVWIIPSAGDRATVIPATETRWSSGVGPSSAYWLGVSEFRLSDGPSLYAFADERRIERFHEGAGREILRIPDIPLAPMPNFDGSQNSSDALSSPSRRILGDWRSAEDIAAEHMRTTLALFDARLTGGVSDRGVDVEHPEAVAQVKMQATPVGSPQVRQLRGARPHLDFHLFYSTSGYTRAALQEAADSGVALFTIGEDGNVQGLGEWAESLVMDGHRRRGGNEAMVARYVTEVTDRITQARENYGGWRTGIGFVNHEALKNLGPHDVIDRAQLYLEGAIEAAEEGPRIGTVSNRVVVSHYRNADLRAAFCCSMLGVPYPGETPIGEKFKRKKLSAADFY